MSIDWTGRTALVTGASAGIGREIARILAREVRTLVLVARRQDRLEELAQELRANEGVTIVVRAVDLMDLSATAAMLESLEREGIAIDVLVNNAGVGDYVLFDKSQWSRTADMLTLNITSPTFLMHRLIPGMVGRGFGAILNVGSTAGIVATPCYSVYGGTKAYLNHVSEVLHAELSGTGVSVTVLCPGPVPTEFQSISGSAGHNPLPKGFIIDAEQCAREALEALRAGRPRHVPGGSMRAAIAAAEALPKGTLRPLARRMGRKARRRS